MTIRGSFQLTDSDSSLSNYSQELAIIRTALARYETGTLDGLHEYLLTQYDRKAVLNADYLIFTVHHALQDTNRTVIDDDGDGFCRSCGAKLREYEKYCSREHEQDYFAQIESDIAASDRSVAEIILWAVQDILKLPVIEYTDTRRDILLAEDKRLNGELLKVAYTLMNAIYPDPKEDYS